MLRRHRKRIFSIRFLPLFFSFVFLIVLVLTLKQAALSENSLGIKSGVFEDNRDVTVFINGEHLQKDLGQKASLSVDHEVDVVSSASIGCTICHHNGEVVSRNEFNVAGTYFLQPETNTAVSLKYYVSTELDYLSNSVTASFVRDFFNRNATLSASYGFSYDNPHPHGWDEVYDKFMVRGSQIIHKEMNMVETRKMNTVETRKMNTVETRKRKPGK